MKRRSLFTISPGAAFLPTFVDALTQGEIIPGFPSEDPLAFAAATIYTPTRRAARALRETFAERLALGASTFLPKIVPLARAEEIEGALDFNLSEDEEFETAAGEAPPPAMDEIERRLIFTRLILAWGRSIDKRISSSDGSLWPTVSDEGFSVTTRFGHAWTLARDLARVSDEFIIEGAPWTALHGLTPEQFDGYWRLTLEFLGIARDHWPSILAERGLIEAVERRSLLLARVADKIRANRQDGPVIAIGSTGTNRATADLLAAISESPRGAVVLPGLDKRLDEKTWSMIADPTGASGVAGHPQAALHRLLTAFGANRAEIAELGRPSRPLASRTDFLSEAMLPADATERWSAFDPAAAREALQNISLIESADEREEALAIAIRMREHLTTSEGAAALITPDRAIAARVRAELLRWGVAIDDSAGQPLSDAPAGLMARLVLRAAMATDLSADFFCLLRHRDFFGGADSPRRATLTALAEISLARTVSPSAADLDRRILQARAAHDDAHAHPVIATASESDFDEMEALVRLASDALTNLRSLAQGAPLSRWVETHRHAIAHLEKRDMDEEDYEIREDLFGRLARAAQAGDPNLDDADYLDLFETLTRELALRGGGPRHARLQILGLLEARLLSFDLILLAGLDETIWPPAASTDAFLNRPMRAALGLSPPERRLGQTAHDFVQALGTPSVVMSRALKRGGAPTSPSRFLQRMRALAGPELWSELTTRGERWIDLAKDLDASAQSIPLPPPRPKPALALRPRRLSVTRIETLRRDPYAIYAEYILKLTPLPPFDSPAFARASGEELHGALADFIAARPCGPLPESALQDLHALTRQRLDALFADVEWRTFQWPRMERALAAFIEWDTTRRASIDRIFVEQKGTLTFSLADGSSFRLTAIADRLERQANGLWSIVDYKSGAAPSAKEVVCGFAPQLTLEAAMLQRGAFACAGADACPSEALYLRLSDGDVAVRRIGSNKAEGIAFEALVEEHYQGMIKLLSQFRNEATPYLPRPFPQFASRYGVWDHLARIKEWSSPSVSED